MTYFAACTCLIQNGLILMMRGRDGLMGLPGGKVEPGELPLKAALRELGEEAGCTVEGVPAYQFEAGTSETHVCITYVYPNAVVHGTPQGNGREGTPVWANPSNLVRHTKYREYNEGLILALQGWGLL